MSRAAAKSNVTHLGHRERLRRRFMESGGKGMPDYEILELILFRGVARRDVKPMAKALLQRFKHLSAVFAAPEEQLKEISGVNASVIEELRVVAAAAAYIGRERTLGRKLLESWEDVVAYCRTEMAEKQTEEFRVLFVDAKNQIIADEVMSTGTVNHAPVYPREIVRRALVLNASALVLVHNHPGGEPTPSKSDIELTDRLKAMLNGLDIRIHDHLIIGATTHASFKHLGLL